MLDGLVALLGVGLGVGALLAAVALFSANFLGLGDGASASGGSTAQESMYIPRPERTTPSDGPLFTLDTEAPGSDSSESSDSTDGAEDEETDEPRKKKSEEDEEITLSAGQTEVANFEQIDLTGIYPGGEGAVLQVQRFESGSWADFDATIPVSGETFGTYVQTGVSGVNRFRVLDPETDLASNEVRVRVG